MINKVMGDHESQYEAVRVAKQLAEIMYMEVPGKHAEDWAQRSMILGALMALVSSNRDEEYFVLMRRTADYFEDYFDKNKKDKH